MRTTKNRSGPAEEREVTFWRRLAKRALRDADTPFYLLSGEPIKQALAELRIVERVAPVPVRHWLSFKTQPVRPLLRWWRTQGFGVEVVSEFELRAALEEGFQPDRILVNGPAKHRWLGRYKIPDLRVNLDSVLETDSLLPLARKLDWSLGVRCQTRGEGDPNRSGEPTQFGMTAREVIPLLGRILRKRVRLETIHFHLRTNVSSAIEYGRALAEVAAICDAAQFKPKYLDCGGGLPAHNVHSPQGQPYDGAFDLEEWAGVFEPIRKRFPGLRELWFENGRFVSARSGVLVVRIVDVKDRGAIRHVICDGGRTTNALISMWETHRLFSIPRRRGPERMSAVCGPTCMAFDRLARQPLPENLKPGDCLVWMDAGAYHIPWETRFSHGHAAVLWHEDEQDRIKRVRPPQAFGEWWLHGSP